MMYAGKVSRGRNDGSDKAKHKKYVLRRLWDYLYFYKTKLFVAIFLTIVANVLSLIGPFLTGRTVDAMTDGVDFEKVFLFAGLMIIFYGVAALLNYLLAIVMVKISQSVVYKMRSDLFEKLNRVKISYFDKNQIGDVISKMSYDIDTINTSLATDVVNILTSSITVILSFIMMLIMSPILVLVFVITLPISIIITRVLSKIVKKKFRIRNQALGELNGFAEEMITGQRTIQSYVQEENVLKRFESINQKTTDAAYQAGYYASSVGPSIGFVSNLSVALVGVFGGILYFLGSLSLGNLTSFTLYSRRFSGPINQMSNIIADIQSALAAAERVFRVLDEEEEIVDDVDAVEVKDVKGIIELRDVSFGYLENELVLKDVSLKTDQGKVIAIVGPTGAGKTTLVNLLMRFYEIEQGQILLDGIDTKMITRASLRRTFSMVLQDTWIFHGTVFDNIAYGNDKISRLEVEEAAKKAHIHAFIKHLPDGYDTILTDEGLNISKGQKQLLVIARAMLSKTKMLILDEATSNVDTHTEVQIQKAMLALMKNKTTFVIAHRLSTIKNADLILVVKDGNIVEQGTHQALLDAKGFYNELYQSQFA
ncbi:multidrug ABC transporter ATP-binding protein [Mariniplasma anaerobium]|uniref:Multidrug ABC transporter ATP-binding protein n=2 Tax=Mariniplasma anaerobium TaxID=2735436 RepID=A0A7U9XVA3_9MOLU|nr:multidrug ABC transporter ATP-binding protein [Mariniplasma anaerobium]